VNFYAIYKNQPLTFTIGVALLQERPWEDFYFCNVVPGARAAYCSPELGELAGARGRGLWTRLRVSFNACVDPLFDVQVIYRALTRQLTTG
jgi:hypothetical protein